MLCFKFLFWELAFGYNCSFTFFPCRVESSEIDLSEFQDQDMDEEAGSGDGNDNNDADGQVGNSTAEEAAGTNGEVSPTHFTLQSSMG